MTPVLTLVAVACFVAAAVWGRSALRFRTVWRRVEGEHGSEADTVVLACTHFPLLMERLVGLAPWPVNWIDPAPAIARRVSDLLGPPGNESDQAGAEMIFTSRRPHTLSQALMPFFGGRVPA